MKKMKTQPIQVPWMISASSEFVEFVGNEEEVKINVFCHYSPRVCEEVVLNLEKYYGENVPDEIYNMAGYATVEIKFTELYFFSQYAKREEYEKYDFSAVDPYYFGQMSLKDIWNETNICPNPGFYEVIESNLKDKLDIRSENLRHWLLSSHDAYIDILAKSFEWKEVK